MKQTKAPAYVAFQAAYGAYMDRQQEAETRRSRLVAVDDPAYRLRQARDSA